LPRWRCAWRRCRCWRRRPFRRARWRYRSRPSRRRSNPLRRRAPPRASRSSRRSRWRRAASAGASYARRRRRGAGARFTRSASSARTGACATCASTRRAAGFCRASGSMRALLVEDDQSLSRSLAAQLERAGYSVERAEDGREGLYYATEYPVDIAIVDLGLPGMSGVELIQRLRAEGKDYPILVLTARDRWQDKVEALKLGADDYVVTPFHVEELLARVDALVRRAGGWAQSELVCGPLTLDTRTQDVRLNGEQLELTS